MLAALSEQRQALWRKRRSPTTVLLEMISALKWQKRKHSLDGGGDGESAWPPTERDSDDDEGNRWFESSRDSRMLPEPDFEGFDALIKRVTLR